MFPSRRRFGSGGGCLLFLSLVEPWVEGATSLTDRNGPFLVEHLPAEVLAGANHLSTNGTGNGYECLIELKRIAILLSALPDSAGLSFLLHDAD